MRSVVLDTETTGMPVTDGHRIIEIGCVELEGRRLTGRHFHVYLQPDREVDEGAIAVHGITNEYLKDKPRFREVANDFFEFIRGAQLIIHNAAFDIGFINNEFALLGQQDRSDVTEYCSVLDTLLMARERHPGQRNNLDALCKRYGVDNSGRDLHGALLDAEILADVYLAMTGGQTSLSLAGHAPRAPRSACRPVHQQGVAELLETADPAVLYRPYVCHTRFERLAAATVGRCISTDGDHAVAAVDQALDLDPEALPVPLQGLEHTGADGGRADIGAGQRETGHFRPFGAFVHVRQHSGEVPTARGRIVIADDPISAAHRCRSVAGQRGPCSSLAGAEASAARRLVLPRPFLTRASRRGLRACRQVSTLSRPAGFARLLLGINNV